jgi:hydrogenase/urease accessory protein HupE
MRPWAVLAVVVVALAGGEARAHELTPSLLSLTERAPGEYDVLWRVPLDEAPRGLLTPVLPDDTQAVGPRRVDVDTQARTERWAIRVPGGIGGRPIRLEGPRGARTDALLRVALADGRVVHARLSPDGTAFLVPAHPSWLALAGTYLRLGIEHILLGFDHLLFVLGLLLLARSTLVLVKTITAFTAAHSVTLALATLGVLHVPGPPVEATIALSIVFVAREILAAPGTSLAAREPWAVALAFGLLHGLGFAGALAEIGLPGAEIPLALAAFNVGVEIGQLAFVAAVLLTLRLARSWVRRSPFARVALAHSIGGVAAALFISRIAAFIGR